MLLDMIRRTCTFDDEAMTDSLARSDIDVVVARLKYFISDQPDEGLKKDAKLMLDWFLDTSHQA